MLPALSRFGHFDEAFMMLLRTGVRSWLYQVANDATTVWERWDAIKPDGSIHDGRMTPFEGAGDAAERGDGNEPHMLSFNHYAYGAVIDWVYRNVGGVAPDVDAPGYRRVRLAPRPCADVSGASTTISTGLGAVVFEWQLEGDVLRASVTLPFGSTGVLVAPVTDPPPSRSTARQSRSRQRSVTAHTRSSSPNRHRAVRVGLVRTQLGNDQIESYRSNGFVVIDDFLDPDELEIWRSTLTEAVANRRGKRFHDDTVMADEFSADEQTEFYDRVFDQLVNLWQTDQAMSELILDPRIGRMAAELAGVDGVRVWHDQALIKRPYANPTAFHLDVPYWSFTSRRRDLDLDRPRRCDRGQRVPVLLPRVASRDDDGKREDRSERGGHLRCVPRSSPIDPR